MTPQLEVPEEVTVDDDGNIKVICRLRKMSKMETNEPERCTRSYKLNLPFINVMNEEDEVESFKFTEIAEEEVNQEKMFKLVEPTLEKFEENA